MHRACAAGRLDAELLAVSKRVSKVLQRLHKFLHGWTHSRGCIVLASQGAWMRSCWR